MAPRDPRVEAFVSNNHGTFASSSSHSESPQLPSPSSDPPAKKKRIRPPTEERRQQNRLAQRHHRDRKDQRLNELEEELKAVKAKNDVLEVQNQELRSIILRSMQAPGNSVNSSNTNPSSTAASDTLPPLPKLQLDPIPPLPPPLPTQHGQSSSSAPTSSATSPWRSGSLVEKALAPISTIESFPFQPPDLNIKPISPTPTWLTDFSTSEVFDFGSTTYGDAVPGLWQSADPSLVAQKEPYNLDGLDFLFGWDTETMSRGRPDLVNLFDIVGDP